MELARAPVPSPLKSIPSAFAAACRSARSDKELFERCRTAMVERIGSDAIWLEIRSPAASVQKAGPVEAADDAVEVARVQSGETDVVISAAPDQASAIKGIAMPLALGVAVVFELHSVLLDRQSALDDAVFQLRALRQVARLLSSVHSTDETEQLVLDFMAEVFFAWWGCLYRPAGVMHEPHAFRALDDSRRPEPTDRAPIDRLLPVGSAAQEVSGELALLLPQGTQLVVPVDAGAERMGIVALGRRISGKDYGRAEHELASTLAFAAAIALKNAELVEQLHSAATTDGLTGLPNRRALEQRLEAELSRCLRHQIRSSIILIDVDHFKAINDSLGHAAGDRLLVLISTTLKQQARTLDVVGRLGGDEFLALLPMTTPMEAMVYVGRVQAAVTELARNYHEFARVTLSLGIAEAPRHGTTPAAILAAADAALYRAKRAGRNAVVVADDP